MPRPLPSDSQTFDRQAHALARDLDAMVPLQVLDQQRRGPVGGTKARLAGIAVDDLGDQRVDDPQCRRGTAAAGSIEEACPEVEPLALQEPIRPVVDRLAAGVEQVGDLFGGSALVEPEQGLGAAPLLGQGRGGVKAVQPATPSIAQDDRTRPATSLLPQWDEIWSVFR